MQRNNTPILIGVVLFGLLALGATVMLLFRPAAPVAGDPTTPGVPTPTPAATRQWVARRNIPPRVRVTTADLQSEQLTAGAVPADVITSPEQLEGLLTRAPIPAGKPISLSMFQPPLNRVLDANIEVPPGFRAVGIWVDPDQTAAGLVDVGDRIDIIANHRLSWDKAPQQYHTGANNFTEGRTIAQNLLVLGVDKSIKAPPPAPTPAPGGAPLAPGAAPTPAPPPPPPSQGPVRTRVILAAPPVIAARLVAANDQGTLHVAIRNPDDGDQVPVPGQREYPSRVVTIRPDNRQANAAMERFGTGLGAAVRQIFPGAGRPVPIPTPAQLPPGIPQPLPGGTDMAPPAPADKEITIIRGTEKTRVIVPDQSTP